MKCKLCKNKIHKKSPYIITKLGEICLVCVFFHACLSLTKREIKNKEDWKQFSTEMIKLGLQEIRDRLLQLHESAVKKVIEHEERGKRKES